MEKLQLLWNNCNVLAKFHGWEVRRDQLVLNRQLGGGQFGVIYGGECNVDGRAWVS